MPAGRKYNRNKPSSTQKVTKRNGKNGHRDRAAIRDARKIQRHEQRRIP